MTRSGRVHTLTFPAMLLDPKLLGGVFGAPSFRVWVTLAAVIFGLGYGLSPEEQATVAALIGGRPLPRERVRELWIIASRRAGKSIFAAALAIFLALQRYRTSPGEVPTLIIITPSLRQSRITKRYISGLMAASPLLRSLIASETASEIVLTNGNVIEVVTASRVAPRGRTLIAVIVDEGAFLPADDAAAEPLAEVLVACRPGLATTDGLLAVIGSPYAQAGPMFEAYRQHYGVESDVLVTKGASQQFNPTIPDRVITQAMEADPSAAGAEWLGTFRQDIESFCTREAAEAVIVPGCVGLPYRPEVSYAGFADFAGGTPGGDSAALAIGHSEMRDGRRIAILDVVVEVRPQFAPDDVCATFAKTLVAYGITTAMADRWAGQFPAVAMAKHGVRLVACESTKSDLYRDLLPLVNSRGCELLDHPRLLAQLVGLERRVGRSGREFIDHPVGRHDDVINVAAGCLVAAGLPRGQVTEVDIEWG
jgi:hypothetical protein